jgi:2-polyprenyl-6-methoxyphenol hydroxylase-like FAD-dependent oxidoreductase
VPEDWGATSGIDWNNPVATREGLLREYADWASPLTDLIRDADDTFWARPIYALPVGHTWRHVPGITLVGDAAHLMSPFAGEGANLAMIDGADLARAVITDSDLDNAVITYEKTMFPRGAKSARTSEHNLSMMFNADSPRALVALFRRMIFLSRLIRPIQRLIQSARRPASDQRR